MYKSALEKINNFYDIDLNKNTHADEMFEVLNDIISFDKAGIFYLTSSSLKLEYGKGFEICKDIKISEQESEDLFDDKKEISNTEIKKLFGIKTNILCQKLKIKNVVLGLLIIVRENDEFNEEENFIFKTCAKIMTNMIKNLELSNIIKMQILALEDNLAHTNQAYDTIKRQNREIKKHEKAQNQFIASVSHDLRTPLNSIIGFSETLNNEIFGSLTPKQKEYIRDIQTAGIRLLGMINEILDLSKLKSNTIKLNLSEIDASLLITEICNILKPLADKKSIVFESSIEPNLTIKGDYIKLQQVLFNIIGNAIKFSHKNSIIKINIQNLENKTQIKIQDFGIGIDKKYHKKIFDKFFQIQDSLSKTEASTGLGLTIAKEFIKLHKGEILVNSKLGTGTTFTINLAKN